MSRRRVWFSAEKSARSAARSRNLAAENIFFSQNFERFCCATVATHDYFMSRIDLRLEREVHGVAAVLD